MTEEERRAAQIRSIMRMAQGGEPEKKEAEPKKTPAKTKKTSKGAKK